MNTLRTTLALSLLVTAGFIHNAFAQTAPSAAPAASPSKNFRFLLGLGFTSGGDTLVDGQYSNGSSYKISAGGGIDIKGGLEYQITPQFAVQGSVGYHSDSTSASNGNIGFKRTPIEVLGFYGVNPKFRLGAGVRSSSGAGLSSSGVASSVGSLTVTGNTGTVIQGDYFFAPKSAFSIRAVNESFTRSDSAKSISGNHVGFYFFQYF